MHSTHAAGLGIHDTASAKCLVVSAMNYIKAGCTPQWDCGGRGGGGGG
jgi:hypothetical protein